MKNITFKLLALLAPFVLLTACDREVDEGPMEAEETGGDQPTNRVDIPASVRSNLGITFAKVERRQVANTIRVPGSFELQPLARHEYRLMLPGRVEFKTDQFAEVKPGTPLYRFRSPRWLELQAQIDLARAALEQTRSKRDAAEARLKALTEAAFKRADLKAQVEDLRADFTKQEAELRVALGNAARTLNLHRAPDADGQFGPDDMLAKVDRDGESVPRYQALEWIEVTATEPGIVESLAVTDGAFVEESTLVLTTVDPNMVRFRALGLQSDLPKFKHDQQVRIVPPRANGSDANVSIEAALTIGLDADPNHRTLTLFATPQEHSDWARSGVSAFLEIDTESTSGPVLAIPRSAVVKDGITHVFFKRDPGNANKAIRVEADLGVDDGRWVEIKSELGPKDEVVLDGAYELKLATAQSGTTQKGGHFHADGSYHGKH